MKSTINLSPRQAALVAGWAIVLMALAAGFSSGFVHGTLVDTTDASTTAQNIRTSETLFRLGILAWVFILILDILVSWSLYIVLKPVNESLSLLTAWMRLVYSAILGMAIGSLVMVLPLLTENGSTVAFTQSQINEQILGQIHGFNGIWSMGLIVFGLHLLGLGYLALRSGFVPKIWGILILIASLGYLLIPAGELIIVDFAKAKSILEMVFMLPMILGELGLGIWLIARGGK
jgi:hypothetical protein